MKARSAGFWVPPTSDLTSHRKQEKMQRFVPQLGKELSQGPPGFPGGAYLALALTLSVSVGLPRSGPSRVP